MSQDDGYWSCDPQEEQVDFSFDLASCGAIIRLVLRELVGLVRPPSHPACPQPPSIALDLSLPQSDLAKPGTDGTAGTRFQ